MSVYVVTGAAGFIGSNYLRFVREVEPDATVVGLDYLGPAANVGNLPEADERFEFRRCDIADAEQVTALLEEVSPDYVVNFAAESHNDRAIVSPSMFTRSNVLGIQTLLEGCRVLGSVTTVVQVSTIEVYGELGAGLEAFTERSPLNAKTPYSASKAAGDLMTRAYMHTYPELDVRMTHCANNYGPYQLPEKLIPLAVTHALQGKKVPLYGDGRQSRDWLHVRDHCAAVHAVLHGERTPIPAEAATDPGLLPIFDVSARHEILNVDIISSVLRFLDLEPEANIEYVADRPNHDRRYIIEPSKIENELGWRPTVDFEQGLRETVQWYVDHRDWWEEIFREKGELVQSWA